MPRNAAYVGIPFYNKDIDTIINAYRKRALQPFY